MLLTHFKTITEIKQASMDDLIRLGIPRDVAENIITHFQAANIEKQ
ncbi:hypothetical protein [Virgibacillus dokdonensis]